ncbi:hypothetical protein [uncultured Parasphingorhabdus sp.]|uniref:hypothetical protein n=1 Tax=uncultured Parasphingorhabdus sp. TaxID=2709694 RepID=UPI0030DBB629|tara:strand:- start:45194 stop:45760 length:567 start_codon:yes stop_codon:yes gene_type:complete
MLKRYTLSAAAIVLALVASSGNATQSGAVEDEMAKPAIPSREDYPDAGQAFGMVWHNESDGKRPMLTFMVPETDNRLWTMRCEKLDNGSVRIAHMIIATPREMVAEDQFGFTVRVDDGASIGVLARMLPTQIEGQDLVMPQFYLPNNHALFPALARGNRAFVNLNGNKFSLHLKGSGDALITFLRACQ